MMIATVVEQRRPYSKRMVHNQERASTESVSTEAPS